MVSRRWNDCGMVAARVLCPRTFVGAPKALHVALPFARALGGVLTVGNAEAATELPAHRPHHILYIPWRPGREPLPSRVIRGGLPRCLSVPPAPALRRHCLLGLTEAAAMGACATKSGDLKVKGETPLVAEDAATAPPVAEGEKAKADGVPAAAEADPADVSRRRSLSDLLKEDAEASDVEAGQEAVKVVTVEDAAVATEEAEPPAAVKVLTDGGAAVATEEAGAPASSLSKEEGEAAEAPQAAVEPSGTVVVVEQDTAEQLAPGDDPKAKGGQEPGGEAKAEEEEKRVDPDSVQVAAAIASPSAEEGSQVADGASA